MSQLALLIDNDVVIKLAQMRVYGEAIVALGYRRHEVGTLRFMLNYMGKSSNARRLAFMRSQQGAADQFKIVLDSIQELETTEDEAKLAAQLMRRILLEELDMDEGEVTLIAVAISRKPPALATGDKRALSGVPALALHEPCVTALHGKFICFEQVVKRLCSQLGMPRVRTAIATDRRADPMVTQAYDACASGGQAYFISALDFVVSKQLGALCGTWLVAI